MHFQVIGHSALFVRSEHTSLLVDPWLTGSCYWRSWWHYPPLGEPDPEWFEADNVYLSHHHFDHFHYPSLRRVNRSATVFVPRFAIDFMAGELRDLGFTRIEELSHGVTRQLGPTFEITSYQYGFDDSALIIADNTATIADFNDCKIRGRSLREIVGRHGSPTFLLKNHSWAQAYPHCYTSPNPADLQVLSRRQYSADFIETVRETKAAYAIPFASSVCFLHPETRAYNDTAITPFEVAEAFAKADLPDSELVIMGPRDSWDPDHGFRVQDWSEAYENRDAHIEELAGEVADRIAASTAEEQATSLHWEDFERHLSRFLAALPPGARFVLKRPIVFEVPSDDRPFWTLDPRTREVSRRVAPPDDFASIVRIDEGLLADAIEKNLLGLVHISMRLKVELGPGGVDTDLMFWAFVTIWEIGYLPLQDHLNRRAVGVALRRRRELTDGVLLKLVGRGSLVERMAANLMADEGDDASASPPSGRAVS